MMMIWKKASEKVEVLMPNAWVLYIDETRPLLAGSEGMEEHFDSKPLDRLSC